MADDLVTLANGKTVTLDEFMSWSPQKQHTNLKIYTISEETRAKISAAMKGKKKTAEHIENNRRANIGRTASEETRAKLSAMRKGKVHSDKAKENMTAVQRNRVLSEDAKARLSAAMKGKKKGPLSAEMKARLSAANKGKKRAPLLAQVMTPKGVFPTRKDAAVAYNVHYQSFSRWLKNRPTEFYVITDGKDIPKLN